MRARLWLVVPLVLLVYAGVNAYIGWNGWMFLRYASVPVQPLLYWLVFSVIAVSFLLARFPIWPEPIRKVLHMVGSYQLFLLAVLVLLLPVIDVAAWVLGLLGYDPHIYVPVLGCTVVGVPFLVLLRGSWNAWTPIVRTYEIRIDKEVAGLKQLRIGMASDFHLGRIVGKRHLAKFVSAMDEMQPDLVLLVGDVIDDSANPFIRQRMADVLGQVKAPHGVFAVLGNHEYYGKQIEPYVQEMTRISVPVLQDDVVSVADLFYIVGRKDKAAAHFDPSGRRPLADLVADLDPARPLIVMDHQPHEYDKAVDAGVDLLLSGHTHRGQFYPNHLFTRKLFELDWGYLNKQTMHAIVSSGFGTWGPPIRLGSRSEVIEIIVHFRS